MVDDGKVAEKEKCAGTQNKLFIDKPINSLEEVCEA